MTATHPGNITLLAGALWLAGLAASQPADAHALLTAPSPRDQSDAHKDPTGPCGVTRSAAQPLRQLSAGAPFNVTWNETVNHPGCFVIDFSAAGDAAFQVLATVAHTTGSALPRPYAQMVTLPAAPCTACTIRVRQIMLGAEPAAGAVCPPANLATGSTYYTCANVMLGGGAVDAGSPDVGGGTDAAVAADGPATGGNRGTGGANAPGPDGSGGASAPVGPVGATGGTGGGSTSAPTGSGGAAPGTTGTAGSAPPIGTPGTGGTTTGGAATGTDQTGACACNAAPSNQSPTLALALAAVFILLLLRLRSRSNQKQDQPNPSTNLSRRIR